MSELLTYANGNQVQIDSDNGSYSSTTAVIATTDKIYELIKFPDPTSNDARYKKVAASTLKIAAIYFESEENASKPSISLFPLLSYFSPSSTTWNNKPDMAGAATTGTIQPWTYYLNPATETDKNGIIWKIIPAVVQFNVTAQNAAFIARNGFAVKQNRKFPNQVYLYQGAYMAGSLEEKIQIRQTGSSEYTRLLLRYRSNFELNFSNEYALPVPEAVAPKSNETVYRGSKVTFKGKVTDPILTASEMNLKGKISIYNSSKNLVSFSETPANYNRFVNVNDGTEFSTVIDTSSLTAGTYYYKVSATNNGESSTLAETDYIPFKIEVGTSLEFSSVSPSSGGSFYSTQTNYITFSFSQKKTTSSAPDIGVKSATVVFTRTNNSNQKITISDSQLSYSGAKFTVALSPNTIPIGTWTVSASGKDTIGGSWTITRTIQLTATYPTLSVQSTSPSSGTELDRNSDNVFSAIFARPAENVGGSYVYGKSAVFIYRESASAVEKTLSPTSSQLTGTPITVEVNVPAGTFQERKYECKWRIVDNLDRTVESSWVSFTAKNLVLVFTNISPSSGVRLNKKSDNTFSATLKQNATVAGKELTVKSGGITYRKKSNPARETFVTGTVSGMSVSAVIRANSLDSDEYEFQWVVVDSDSKSVESEWMLFTTLDALPVTSAYSPNGVLVSGNEAITFYWIHSTATGSAQTQAELQFGEDGVTWGMPIELRQSQTEWTATAGIFTSGEWFWRVRSANLDGNFGEFSQPAKFTVVGIPAPPIIIVTNDIGRPSIKWQSAQQAAFEITLDNGMPEMHRGDTKTWISPQYLEDGEHSITVRVQNKYNLWSAPATAVVTVTHASGSTINVDASAERSVTLTWSSSGYDFYIVYRDGTPICKTQLGFYEDRYSIDECEYQIRGCYNDNFNYGLSAKITITCTPPEPCICEVGGEWIDLELSDTQHRAFKVNRAVSVQNLRLSGHAYPAMVKSNARTLSISIDFSIPIGAPTKQFKELLGKTACLKIPAGEMVIGTVKALDTSYEEFYSTWSIAVEQSNFSDEVSLDE